MNDKYLTTSEASEIFKFPKQTLYNLINKGILIKGIHYFKPVPKKILFSQEGMRRWVESSGNYQKDMPPCPEMSPIKTDESISINNINI